MTARALLDLGGAALVAAALFRPAGAGRALPLRALLALGLFAALGIPFWLWGLPAGVPAALLACGWLWATRGRPPAPAAPVVPDPFPPHEAAALRALALAAIAVALALFAEHSLRFPDGDWDAWAMWNVKARFLFHGAPRAALSPHLPHADYPLLVPSGVAQLWSLAGSDARKLAALHALLWAALGAGAAAWGAARLRGATTGWLVAGLLASTPWWVVLAWNQYADLPLGACLAASVALLAVAAEQESPDLLPLAGAFAGLGLLAKNEGALAFAGLLLGLLSVRPRARGLAAFGLAAAPFALLFWAGKAATPAQNDLVAAAGWGSLARLVAGERWAVLGQEGWALLRDLRSWGPMLFAAAVAVPLALRAPAARAARPSAVCLITCAAGYLAVLLTTPHDLRWHVQTTLDRLLGQLWPTLALWLALRLAPRPAATARR